MVALTDFAQRLWTNISEDRLAQLAAAVAYYAIFSLSPVLLIVLSTVTLVVDEQTAQKYLVDQFRGLAGERGAEFIETLLTSPAAQQSGPWALAIGIIATLLGATGLMMSLQDTLNQIWKVELKPTSTSWLIAFWKRLISLAMVVSLGFLLLTSLVLSAGVRWAISLLPHIFGESGWWLILADAGLSFLLFFLIIAALFAVLPDVVLPWGAIGRGAAWTAGLFLLGKYAIGTYLGQASVTSSFGAAGSAIVVLLWVYYSTQILLVGMELIKTRMQQSAQPVIPRPYAELKPCP
jgi:membrane protein